jgi:histidinol phosphatase-like enzyme (inositol monophosphatase family)
METVQIPSCSADLAQRLADAARSILQNYYRKPIPVDAKSDASPVTQADRDAESAMRDILKRAAPDHGIVGEEFGSENADAEFVWVLDPLDGTRAFISGKPTFGTLIGLAHKGVPVLGVIDMPILNERWVGGHGMATVLNGTPAHTRACASLRQARIGTTSPEIFSDPERIEAFSGLRRHVLDCNYGGDCYGYGLLASGWLDIVMESTLQPYDFAAIAPVIAGAGGVMTDWAGQPLTLASNGDVLASGDPGLHGAALGAITKS